MNKNSIGKYKHTPVFKICNAINLTTVLQKWGGGGWAIKAAVAEEQPSIQTPSDTIKAWNIK